MPEEIVSYISKYGYLAILVIIVLQETGVPSPIPVELLVCFTGYLSFKGFLYLPFVIITAIAADFIGANIIYFIFYTSGIFLVKKKPRWIPVSEEKISRFREKISNGGWLNIFLFRLVSVTRGYSAIISGLLHVKLRIYFPVVLMSALTWAAVYAILGFILGPSWDRVINDFDHFKFVLLGILLLIVTILIFRSRLKHRQTARKKETSGY